MLVPIGCGGGLQWSDPREAQSGFLSPLFGGMRSSLLLVLVVLSEITTRKSLATQRVHRGRRRRLPAPCRRHRQDRSSELFFLCVLTCELDSYYESRKGQSRATSTVANSSRHRGERHAPGVWRRWLIDAKRERRRSPAVGRWRWASQCAARSVWRRLWPGGPQRRQHGAHHLPQKQWLGQLLYRGPTQRVDLRAERGPDRPDGRRCPHHGRRV